MFRFLGFSVFGHLAFDALLDFFDSRRFKHQKPPADPNSQLTSFLP